MKLTRRIAGSCVCYLVNSRHKIFEDTCSRVRSNMAKHRTVTVCGGKSGKNVKRLNSWSGTDNQPDTSSKKNLGSPLGISISTHSWPCLRKASTVSKTARLQAGEALTKPSILIALIIYVQNIRNFICLKCNSQILAWAKKHFRGMGLGLRHGSFLVPRR